MSSSSASTGSASTGSAPSSPRFLSLQPQPSQKRKRKELALEAPSDADELVLSHAAKRKEKKRQRIQDDGTSGTATEASTSHKKKSKQQGGTDEVGPAAPSKRQNSVWVGNLPFKATPDALKRVFHEAGEITRIHMPTKHLVSSAEGGTRKENRGLVTVPCTWRKATT